MQALLSKPNASPGIELAQQLYRASEEGFLVQFPRRVHENHPTRLAILPTLPLCSPTRSSSSCSHDTDTAPSSCCPSPLKLPLAPTPSPDFGRSHASWFRHLPKRARREVKHPERHHPEDDFKKVPYWLSYEPEVIDQLSPFDLPPSDVGEQRLIGSGLHSDILMMYASSANPFRLLGAPPEGPFSVLDLGCGPTAHWSLGALAANPRTATITALDMCPLLLPRPLPEGLNFVQYDFLKGILPFPKHVSLSPIASRIFSCA